MPTKTYGAEPLGSVVRAQKRTAKGVLVTVYHWLPPQSLKGDLPDDFTLEQECYLDGDGERRFYLNKGSGYGEFAWAAGLALLKRVGKLSQDEINRHRLMWFYYLHMLQRRESLGNQFKHLKSLYITKLGREGGLVEERTVLPDDVGLGGGEVWDRRRLIAEGRAEARRCGHEKPKTTACLQYGMLQAARLSPMKLPPQSVLDVIRRCLLLEELKDGEVSQADLMEVDRRFQQLFAGHLDDSPEKLNSWYRGHGRSWISWLARAKKRTAEPALDTALVRSALLQLGWEAYYRVAACLDEAMKNFGTLITPDLSARERDLFARMHLRRAAFGGLPIVMLTERLSFALPAFGEVLENDGPEGNHAAVLHRVLYWYAEIAPKRRQADRLIHARTLKPRKGKAAENTGASPASASSGADDQVDSRGRVVYQGCRAGTTGESSFLESTTDASSSKVVTDLCNGEYLDLIGVRTRAAKDVSCPCPEPRWNVEFSMEGVDFKLIHRCGACNASVEQVWQAASIKRLLNLSESNSEPLGRSPRGSSLHYGRPV